MNRNPFDGLELQSDSVGTKQDTRNVLERRRGGKRDMPRLHHLAEPLAHHTAEPVMELPETDKTRLKSMTEGQKTKIRVNALVGCMIGQKRAVSKGSLEEIAKGFVGYFGADVSGGHCWSINQRFGSGIPLGRVIDFVARGSHPIGVLSRRNRGSCIDCQGTNGNAANAITKVCSRRNEGTACTSCLCRMHAIKSANRSWQTHWISGNETGV
jgi:hypothetical protein